MCDIFLVVDSLSMEAAFQMVSHFWPRVDLTRRALVVDLVRILCALSAPLGFRGRVSSGTHLPTDRPVT